MTTFLWIVGIFLVLCFIFGKDKHEDKEINEKIDLLMGQIRYQLAQADIVDCIDYSLKYKRHKEKDFDYIAISFYNMSLRPENWATPVANIINDTFKVNRVMAFDNSAFYTKPYLRFNCTKKGYENYYIKVYFVHSAWGWLKTISESFEEGSKKGRNVKGMFGDKK